jgi:NTE family protein
METEARDGRVDLVFEGGGIKGLGLVGALDTLEQKGYEPQNLAGASAGAIVAALYGAGYSAGELHEVMGALRFTQFRDERWEGRIPLLGEPLDFLLDLGLYRGEAFLEWMRQMLAEKDVRTFGDLIYDENAEPRYRHKVQVIASDVSQRRLLVLPMDADKIGIPNPDELEVAEAVRMSMSIPIFFEPVRWREPQTGEEHVIVDGGMLSNFPVWLFDAEGKPEWPTFGLRLVKGNPDAAQVIRPLPPGEQAGRLSLIEYLKDLLGTMLEAHDRLYIEEKNFVRTIAIDTMGVHTTQFDLTREQAESLYDSGKKAAEEFLDKWSFDEYLRTFRSDNGHSRRETMSMLLQAGTKHDGQRQD